MVADKAAKLAVKSGAPSSPLSFAAVQGQAILDHCSVAAEVSVFYSKRAHAAAAASLREALHEPQHKRAKFVHWHERDLAGEGGSIVFRVTICKKLNQPRIAPVSHAVAERFDPNDIAATLHESTPSGHIHGGLQRQVYCEPVVGRGDHWGPCVIASGLSLDINMLGEHFRGWTTRGTMFLELSGTQSILVRADTASERMLTHIVC